MTAVTLTVNLAPIGLNEYEISKEAYLNASWSVEISDGDTLISEGISVSDPDSGITVSTRSVSGYFEERLLQDPIPPVYYLDSNDQLQSVPTWNDLPLPSDPNFKCLVNYEASTLTSEVISYTHVLVYETQGETGLEQITISTPLILTVINNWNGDRNKVASATTFGGGKPMATLGSMTSGHTTYPPTAIIEGSSKVFINGKPAARHGDKLAPHTSVAYSYPTHQGSAVGGSTKVFIEGKAAVRIGDDGSCGGLIAQGEVKVLCN